MATVSVFCGAGFLGRVAVRRLAAAGIAWRVATWPEGVYSIARFELRLQHAGTRVIFDHTGFPPELRDHLAAGWEDRLYHAVTLPDYTFSKSGCSSAWLECLLWEQEVAGSNPATPTKAGSFKPVTSRIPSGSLSLKGSGESQPADAGGCSALAAVSAAPRTSALRRTSKGEASSLLTCVSSSM